jgi:hypothetical protein
MGDRLRDEVERLRREATVLEHQALVLRQAADQIEAGINKAARLATAETSKTSGHAARNLKIAAWGSSSPLAEAARAKGLTLRALARALGISPASLTHYQRGRPVPRAVADQVHELTGFADWPGGVAE